LWLLKTKQDKQGTSVLTLLGHCAFWASNVSFVYWLENKMSLCQPLPLMT